MQIKNLFTYWASQAFSPATVLREKYAAFKSLLEQDKQAHDLMAQLEEIYHEQKRVDFSVIEKKYAALSACVSRIVSSLNRMHPSRYLELDEFYRKIDGYARHMLSPAPAAPSSPYCLPLGDISPSMRPLVGEKTLNLAMAGRRNQLPIPAGFVITTNAFFRFTRRKGLREALDEILAGIDVQDLSTLNRASRELTELIRNAQIPAEVASMITAATDSLCDRQAGDGRMAVRSSAVGEDSEASFAGQYKSMLNVGPDEILEAYKAVVASKYSPEAMVYRINYGLSDAETPMAVLVVEMIDAAASGVVYTQEPDDPASDMLEIHSVFGLGEMLVQGEVSPDRFKIRKGAAPELADKQPGGQKRLMAVNPAGRTRMEDMAADRRSRFSIEDDEALALAEWGMQLEKEAGGPRDIEWCLDRQGRLRLLQSRPLKTVWQAETQLECRYEEISNPTLVTGADRAAAGVAAGPVFVALSESELADMPENAVLVTRTASANFVRAIEKVSAVVSESGSPAGHFASVAREFGIPMVVNAEDATRKLKPGETVTVFAEAGKVYEGTVAFLLDHPCLRRQPIADSPLARKLAYIMGFVSPLALVDPQAADFSPGGCRSLHDVIRFAHEAGTREMFTIGDRAFGRSRGARKLVAGIPMLIYLMDVGGGMADDTAAQKTVAPQEIRCLPFRAVWQGLNHPGIKWGEFTHFNWAEYDKIVMSGGIISAESAQLASYAVLSTDYLNLNLKFGYHFVILDSLCGDKPDENHILFRFNGGGGDEQGRSLRADFLQSVLEGLEFDVTRTSDLVDARFSGAAEAVIMEKLDQLGRLLGATRLMDMYLNEAAQVGPFVEAFFNGRYHFATVEMDQ